MIPPNALEVSQANALLYASNNVEPLATPQGFACLIIATVLLSAGSNSLINCNAASASFKLL